MEKIMKHLPLTLQVLTFLMVASLFNDARSSHDMREGMKSRMGNARMAYMQKSAPTMNKGSRGDQGRTRREEGKRGPKKEDN